MGIFRALRDMRSVEEQQAGTYEDLVKDMGKFYQECELAGLTNEDDLITLKEKIYNKEINYFLNRGVDSHYIYTLELQCDQGLPGVSFVDGPVEYVLYYLTKDINRARVLARRRDSNEEVTVSPEQNSPSFWSQIEGLSGVGMDVLRRLSRL